MDTLESSKWQNAYTENKGFDDSLKRTGALLIPTLVALIIPFFYVIYYVFRLLNEISTEKISSSAQVVIYLSPGIILALLIFVFFFLSLTLILRSAGAFLKEFYNLPDSINIKSLVGLRVFGRMPTPPPLSQIVKFPSINVKNGNVEPVENWHTLIGGPAKLQIDPGNAVYLERGDQFSRVVGQGTTFLDLHERIKAVVHLGPQSRIFEVSAWTKDGIRIDLQAKGEYFLGSPERNTQNESMLIPFDAEAVRKAVEQTLMSGKEGHEWIEGAIGKTKGILSNFITNRHLEEIFKEDMRLFTKATMETLLMNINQSLENSGVHLSHFQITDANTHKEITNQRLESWETDYKSHEIIIESKGKAHQIREREKARAEMQRNLIYTLANGLERIDLENFSEPLLLSITALLDQSMSDPQIRAALATEALETLEKTQQVIKFNFQTPGDEK
jgi:hypothetical protein